ncbi:MerR family transcriptional regulator [Pseudoalteromonas sp. R3]|uniref:MerR family transcriptional regulator n=1 Tax=Pseudoalteromonas sp. R3 TaxID=1709477 RepID=UPI0006B52EFE|nr:MerR family transcriptional regulator [Pseudoalteromonas sp. R3]AZZ98164.1 MerR family transcriptional regulator [Pseudoalteromonas sp. R3]
MYIGEVAKKTGLSVKAIRFYEEKDLIIAPKRKGVYRIYTPEHIEVLKLISEAKDLGVTLSELKGVIKYHNGSANWTEINAFLVVIRQRLENELQAISEKIAKLDICIGSISSCQKTA